MQDRLFHFSSRCVPFSFSFPSRAQGKIIFARGYVRHEMRFEIRRDLRHGTHYPRAGYPLCTPLKSARPRVVILSSRFKYSIFEVKLYNSAVKARARRHTIQRPHFAKRVIKSDDLSQSNLTSKSLAPEQERSEEKERKDERERERKTESKKI